jgi:hypothetical protein
MNTPLRILACFALLAAVAAPVRAGGLAPSAPMDESSLGLAVGSIPIPSGISAVAARDVIAYSLVARGWTVKEKDLAHVVGHLNHRGTDATITFRIEGEMINVFCDGWRVDKQGQRVKPDQPDSWIKNIKNDVTRRLAKQSIS